MSNIRVETQEDGKTLTVSSPYHPDFVGRAKELGGRWKPGPKVWAFDVRDTERVQKLLRNCYGHDGSTDVEVASIRVDVSDWDDQEAFVGDRCIAKRPYRDAAVRLGQGCILISGGFKSSGGSQKYPLLKATKGTVIEVRDVPLPMALDLIADDDDIEIVSEEVKQVETLRAREKELLYELEVVRAQISKLEE